MSYKLTEAERKSFASIEDMSLGFSGYYDGNNIIVKIIFSDGDELNQETTVKLPEYVLNYYKNTGELEMLDADYGTNQRLDIGYRYALSGNFSNDGYLQSISLWDKNTGVEDKIFSVQKIDNFTTRGLTVDNNARISGLLTVDSNTQLKGTLTVKENSSFEKKLTIEGDVAANSKVTVSGDLEVYETLVVSKQVNANSGLFISDGNLEINNGKTFLEETSVSSGLTVSKGAQISDGLSVFGGASISGILYAKDNTFISGNTTISGMFEVHGTSTDPDYPSSVFHGGVYASGLYGLAAETIFSDTIIIANHSLIVGVNPSPYGAPALEINHGDSILGGNLTVKGDSKFSGLAAFNDGIYVSGNSNLSGDLTINGMFAPSGLYVDGDAKFSGRVTIGKSVPGDFVQIFNLTDPRPGHDYDAANVKYVNATVSGLMGLAPDYFDTLKEIADYLDNHSVEAADYLARLVSVENFVVNVSGDFDKLSGEMYTAINDISGLADVISGQLGDHADVMTYVGAVSGDLLNTQIYAEAVSGYADAVSGYADAISGYADQISGDLNLVNNVSGDLLATQLYAEAVSGDLLNTQIYAETTSGLLSGHIYKSDQADITLTQRQIELRNLAYVLSGVVYSYSSAISSISGETFNISGFANNVSGNLLDTQVYAETVSGSANATSGHLLDTLIILENTSGNLDSVSGVLGSVSGFIDNYSGDIYSEISGLAGYIDEVSGKLTEYVNDVSGQIYVSINSISGKIENLSGLIDDVEVQVTTVSGVADTILNNFGNYTTDIAKIQPISGDLLDTLIYVEDVSGNLLDTQTYSESISGDLNTVSGTVNSVKSYGEDTRSKLDAVSGLIDLTISPKIGNVSGDLDTVSGDLYTISGALDQQILDVESQADTKINNLITALKSAVANDWDDFKTAINAL